MRILRKALRRTPFYAAYKTLGHYPDFWYWKLRGSPVRPPHLVKQRTVQQVSRDYKLQILVETGTYYGEMVAALKNDFDQIYSVECDPRLASQARKRFRSMPHVHILEGPSQLLMPELLKSIPTPALFWLDAGYFTWDGAVGDIARLMSELAEIFAHPVKDHVVLIDDVVPFSGRDGLPELREIESRIKAQFPARDLCVKNSILCITHGPAETSREKSSSL